MSRGIWFGLGFLVLATLGVVWFLHTHEQREVSVPISPKGEAWRDRFLAASELLYHFGVPSRQFAGLENEHAVATNALLVVPAPRGLLSAAAVQRIHAQVTNGAHLIVESEPRSAADPVLDDFDVARAPLDNTSCISKDEIYAYDFAWHDRLESSGVTSNVLLDIDSVGAPPVKVSILGGENLDSSKADWRAKACDGVRILHRVEGRGRLTVVNDISFLTNWRIGRDDNAEFFWRVAQLGGKPGEAVFFGVAQSGLKDWLRLYAWRVVAALAAFLLLWLWSMVPRFGPIRPDAEPARRRLLDHLRANGRLLWAHGARAPLAQAARNSALDRVMHAHPHARAMSPADLVAFLERRFRLPHAWALLFLPDAHFDDVPRMIALARACRALHAQLRRGASPSDPLYDPTSDPP